MTEIDAENHLAAAYLNRVAEPNSPALFRFVTDYGYVEAAKAVRAGTAPNGVLRATEARRDSADPHSDLEAADRNGIRLLTPADPEWPHLAFSALHSVFAGSPEHAGSLAEARPAPGRDLVPPLALWVKGNGVLDDLAVHSAAIVGSRASTAYGTHLAAEFGYGLASQEITVVSGGAFGIDASAHRGAIAADGLAILVSAAGLDRPYPAANHSLFERVAECGLLVSERPPGSAPHRHRFLSRNRVIAALGSVTVVVEAARRSGALNTARFARQLGRCVLAVPGPVTSALSVGCHDLLQRESDPATLVTGVADILPLCASFVRSTEFEEGSAGQAPELPPDRSAAAYDRLDEAAQRVFDGVPFTEAVDIERIARLSGQPADVVRQALPRLVAAQLVTRTGDGFSRRPGAAS